MSTRGKNPKNNGIWINIAKILIFILALYLAYLVLRPLLSIVLGLSFWIIKLAIFLTVAFLVIHLFLKLIFRIDLIYLIFGRSWPK